MTDVPVSRSARTLATTLDHHRNALNVIRLGLALVVVFDHAAPLGGFATEEPHLGTTSVGSLAVAGFFCLSGYLIASARTRTGTIRFAWHRFLRIFPGYWACLLVVAVLFAPHAWWEVHGSLAGFRAGDALRYVVQNVPLITPRAETIPGTLDAVPKPASWNTSLWTLQWELFCYAVVALLASAGLLVRQRRHLVAGALGLVLLVGMLDAVGPALPAEGGTTLLVRFGATFLAGVVLYLYADEVPVDGRLAAVCGLLVLSATFLPEPHGIIALPLAYALLWLGATWRTSRFRHVDVSYGVYIYAFPVQQTLALVGFQRHGHVAFLVASVLGTIPLAVASFHLVERPALGARSWTPRFRRPIAIEPADGVTVAPG